MILRAWAAAQIARLPRGLRADRVDAQICASTSHAEAAALLNVSRRGVQNAAVVRDHGVPELQALVARGDLRGQDPARCSARRPSSL